MRGIVLFQPQKGIGGVDPVGGRRAIGGKMTAYVQGVDATGWKLLAHQSAIPPLKTRPAVSLSFAKS